jgi:hypothetical protein
MLNSTIANGAHEGVSLMRASQVLRGILGNNPGVKTFSVERILSSIGEDHFEASLMMFSIPAIVPVPGPSGLVTMPTGVIACQMVAGHKQIRLPRFILKKSVSRRALAVAIHTILPILEAAEKVVRPRWSWINHSIWRQVIGLFVLLLAIATAFPLFGFNALHATSIFVISLGMAEKDGLAVMIGVVAGVLSLAILASGMSARAVRSKVASWLWKISRKLGIAVFARFLDRLGHKWLAKVLRLEWSDLLLRWDPEKRAADRAETASRAKEAPARESPIQPEPKVDRPYRSAERVRRARSAFAADASLSSALA